MAQDKDLTPGYKVFEDRRNYPRLKINIPAEVTGSSGQTVAVTLYDLSPESAQIRFPIAGGTNLFPSKTAPIEEIKSLWFAVSFELSYKGNTYKIKLNAHPVYLRTVDDKIMSSGILFIENKWEEMKKVSDYLFYQLESAFSDTELLKKFKRGEAAEQQVPEKAAVATPAEDTAATVQEVQEEHTDKTKAESDIEFLKTEMMRIAASLKTIQEITKHIDEKVLILEHKISKKS